MIIDATIEGVATIMIVTGKDIEVGLAGMTIIGRSNEYISIKTIYTTTRGVTASLCIQSLLVSTSLFGRTKNLEWRHLSFKRQEV
jgi:hypothetical protein